MSTQEEILATNIQNTLSLFDVKRKIDTKQKKAFICDSQFFSLFYLFTTEDLPLLFGCLDTKNKSVLTVGSSCDQILFALAGGAKKVVHFDINPICKHYYDYKTALIRAFTYKEFKHLFKRNKIFDLATFEIIKQDLPKNSQNFWNALFENGLAEDPTLVYISRKYDLPYSEQKYLTIKQKLQSPQDVSFINCDLRDLHAKLKPTDKFVYTARYRCRPAYLSC